MLVGLSLALVFFVAPEDADQGISQKIFYFHVPIALTAYACFGWGALKALLYLWRKDERYDLESYVGIHLGTDLRHADAAHRLDLGEGLLGRLVDVELEPARALPRPLPLLLRLLHAPLLGRGRARGGRRSPPCTRSSASCSIPVSFFAIRLASDFIHPTVFNREGPQMSGTMFATFCVAWGAITVLAYVLYRVELAGKLLDQHLRELREALA